LADQRVQPTFAGITRFLCVDQPHSSRSATIRSSK